MSGRRESTSGAPWYGVARPDLGWVPPLRYLSRRHELLRIFESWPEHSRVLEVGCGAGALLHDLKQRGFDVSGVETSHAARSLALRLRDAQQGDWPIHSSVEEVDGLFDVVAAFDVIEHIEDDVGALLDWRPLVRPGGLLCVSVPAHRDWWGPGDVWAGHFRRYDQDDIRQALNNGGWDVEKIVPYGFPVASFAELVGRPYYARSLARQGSIDPENATARSGIERKPYLSIWSIMGSRLGGAFLRAVFSLQVASWPERWCAGYIAIARARG